MKRKRIGLMIVSLLLVCAMAVNLTGCSAQVQAKNLMEGVTPKKVKALDDPGARNADITDFAVRLFQAGEKSGENTLVSPLSVLCALAMTANGAQGETLEQMEAVLGMTAEELNRYLYGYVKNLPRGETYKLNLANSIWFTEDSHFTVNRDFLQRNADYYGADIYQAPFDGQTCKDVNSWVKQKTDGMIPEILDQIPPDAVMYLVNALAFEAEWAEVYKEHQVRDGRFTREDGAVQDAELMYGSEGVYLEDEKASGFIKYYKGGGYAFAAMLPHEGVSVSDYVASLDGGSLSALLANPRYTTVLTAIPKFGAEYGAEMSEILKGMGMPRAFDSDSAEFEGLGVSAYGNIYISRVLHKAFISVGEKGTKAGATTVVEMLDGAAMADPQEPKRVYLDRPFVYMLIDRENNIPFFIGTMMGIEP